VSAHPTVRLFGAVPDTRTQRLVDELRASGMPVRALYRAAVQRDADADAAAGGEGRGSGGTPLLLTADDVVTGSTRAERQEWRDARGAHVMLSGGGANGFDLARRALVSRWGRTVHLWDARLRHDKLLLRALRRGYFGPWCLDGIFTLSTRTVDAYRAVTGHDIPVHVLPHVTDRGLGIEPRPAPRPTIGYAGRLLPDRGVDLLLRALARLPASERPRLQVAGAGPEAEALHNRAARLGIYRWVDWLGEVDADTLDGLRARWWAMAVPARRDGGWGTLVHEAMNTGVPVIASGHVLAATDLVRHGRNGVIVRREDPDRWAAAIGEALDPATRDARSTAARAVGRAFAPEHAASWLIDVLGAAGDARHERGRHLVSRSFVEHVWSDLVPEDLRPHPATST
jgi:glycosyltransferase involved in cell wall biosynthesis